VSRALSNAYHTSAPRDIAFEFSELLQFVVSVGATRTPLQPFLLAAGETWSAGPVARLLEQLGTLRVPLVPTRLAKERSLAMRKEWPICISAVVSLELL